MGEVSGCDSGDCCVHDDILYDVCMTSQDPGDIVVLKSTPTAFEADTITMTLRNAGIDARTVNTATAMTLVGTGIGDARVMVRRGDLQRARQVLSEVEHESSSIDWDDQDVGVAQETPPAPLSRRAAWTIVILVLAPLGVIAMMSGQMRGDPILTGLAMMTMLVGMILAGWLLFGGGDDMANGDDSV